MEHVLDKEEGHSKIPQPLSPTAQSKSNATISQSLNKSSDISKPPTQPSANKSNNSAVNTTTPGNNSQTSSNTSGQTQPSTPNRTSSSGTTTVPNSTPANQTEIPKPDTNTTAPKTSTNPQTADPSTQQHTQTAPPKPEQPTEEPTVEPAISYYWVVHTHLDLGWLHPEQELFDYKVRSILDTTLDYLSRNSDARMTFSDFGFVYMYLNDPAVTPEVREGRKRRMQAAFATRQMEAVNGGFVLPDYAVTTHDELLSNWQFGNRWIRDQFNASSTTMWSIDQFGHSRTATRLAKECGYHENFINRVIHKYQGIFRKGGDIIFRWRYGEGPGDELTTLQLEQHYEILKFRVDVSFWGASDFMMYNQEYILATNFNFVGSCVEYFDYVGRWTNYTKSRVKLIPFGGDFHFEQYADTIHFIEQLAICVRSNNRTGRFAGKFDVRTTTLSEFLRALKDDFIRRNLSLKTFTFDESYEQTPEFNSTQLQPLLPVTQPETKNYGDLLPYTENLYNSMNRIAWSGYYTTAPFAKKVMRSHGELHRGLRNIFTAQVLREKCSNTNDTLLQTIVKPTLTGLQESDWATVANLHHDAITGVSTNFVNTHYMRRCQTNTKESRLEWKAFVGSLVFAQIDVLE